MSRPSGACQDGAHDDCDGGYDDGPNDAVCWCGCHAAMPDGQT